jgi:formylglycine-generating enzyme required for sulfatase activity
MYWLKSFSIGLLLLISFNSIAEQPYTVPSMVTIPAGEFIMGSKHGQPVKIPHSPEHQVNISTFQLSKYEVTVKEFRQFVADTHHEIKTECWKRKTGTDEIEMAEGSWNSPQYAPSDFHPVICVGPDDALAYVAWLSKKTGQKYRLASEAEWEYAARAGSQDNYFFGNDERQLCEYANIFDKSGERAFKRDLAVDWSGVACDDHAEYTSVVGMYKPNAFGLFDMIGNVGEIVEDCQHSSYEGAPSNGSVWAIDCDKRELFFGVIVFADYIIHRGGNYGSSSEWSRIFIRGHTGKSNASSLGEGFRLARDMIEDKSNDDSAERVKNTEAFLKELFIAQEKFRK